MIMIEVGVLEYNYSTHSWRNLLNITIHKLLQPRILVRQTQCPFVLIVYVTSDDVQAHKQSPFVFECKVLGGAGVSLNIEGVVPVFGFKANKIFFP